VAGGSSEILLPGSVATLRDLAHGAPGLMNALADNALFEAFLAGRDQVTRKDVESAWQSLGWSSGLSLEAKPARGPAGHARSAELRSLAESTAPDLDPMGELGSELDAVFEPGASSGSGRREASPVSAAPTQIELGEAAVLEAPPKDDDDVDAVDELFMELIDDD
jgi:hypothetical protein